MLEYLKKFAPRNPWHFMWIATVFSLIFTSITTVSLSYLFFGKLDYHALQISLMDGFIVPLIVSPFVIYFIVAERKQVENELHELSLTDELTDLRNRRGFYILAEQELKLADRSKKGIYIMYADIDKFKHINDTYGHAEGDRLLLEVAEILKTNYRLSDVISRIGGDEFVIIPIAMSEDSLDIITARFQSAVELYNRRSGKDYNLSVSIGMALYDPLSPCTLDELLNRADRAMYKDKMNKNSAQPNTIDHMSAN